MSMLARKRCKNLKAAEHYQSVLYRVYDSVKLVQWPRFEEAGLYVWEVSQKGDR